MTKYVTRLGRFIDDLRDAIYRKGVPSYVDINLRFYILKDADGRPYYEVTKDLGSEYGLRTVDCGFNTGTCLLVGDKIGGNECKSVEFFAGEHPDVSHGKMLILVSDIADEELVGDESIIMVESEEADWYEKLMG